MACVQQYILYSSLGVSIQPHNSSIYSSVYLIYICKYIKNENRINRIGIRALRFSLSLSYLPSTNVLRRPYFIRICMYVVPPYHIRHAESPLGPSHLHFYILSHDLAVMCTHKSLRARAIGTRR